MRFFEIRDIVRERGFGVEEQEPAQIALFDRDGNYIVHVHYRCYDRRQGGYDGLFNHSEACDFIAALLDLLPKS